MMCIMAQGNPYGHLALSNGIGVTEEQLAKLTGGDDVDVKVLLAELEKSDVFSRTEAGVPYSRRMVKDFGRMNKSREVGRLGGNPALKEESRIQNPELESIIRTHNYKVNPTVNPPLNPGVNLVVNPRVNPTLNPPDDSFQLFWSAYPNKKAKKAALKAWKAAKDKPSIEVIRAAIEAQMVGDDWLKEGGRFIPHPATWLNQGRWDDVPTLKQQTGGRYGKETDRQRIDRERAEKASREFPEPDYNALIPAL